MREVYEYEPYEHELAPGMKLCPNCRGMSPTQETIRRQYAATGDCGGACGACDNTHEVPDENSTVEHG